MTNKSLLCARMGGMSREWKAHTRAAMHSINCVQSERLMDEQKERGSRSWRWYHFFETSHSFVGLTELLLGSCLSPLPSFLHTSHVSLLFKPTNSCFIFYIFGFFLAYFQKIYSLYRHICFKCSQMNVLNASAVEKTTDEENKFQNSRPFYSFRASGCKLGFQTWLRAVPHPVSIFLQLVATHKNTCLLQTVQSR